MTEKQIQNNSSNIVEAKSTETALSHPNQSIVDQNPNDAFHIIESRNKVFDRVMSVAIKATSSNDWTDFGGKPFLESSGAEKIARRFGVTLGRPEVDKDYKQDDEGSFLEVTVMGEAWLSDKDRAWAIGTCSSRDKFFGTKKDKDGNKIFKPMSEISTGDVIKKAYANWTGNVIKKLLGLKGLSWDDLSQFGITRNGKSSVQFNKRSNSHSNTKSASNKSPVWTSEHNGRSYLWVQACSKLPQSFLMGLGFKSSSKDPNKMFMDFNANALEIVNKQYIEGGLEQPSKVDDLPPFDEDEGGVM